MRPASLGLREFKVHFGAFDYTVFCVVGRHDRANKYIAWKLEDPTVASHEETRGTCFHRSGYCPIIWIPRAPRTPREYATLAHEMLHAVRHLMEWAAIPFNADTNEAYCHALGHGMYEVLTALGKRAKK